jgi:hypothetical protein
MGLFNSNGGIIGKVNNPSGSTAKGSWSLLQQFLSASAGSWPPPVLALFGGGFTSANTAVTDKYTYSNDAVAGGTALGTARQSPAATGNSTRGIFGGGYTTSATAVTDKYTYSGDAVAAGTNLVPARYWLAAASSSPGGF